MRVYVQRTLQKPLDRSSKLQAMHPRYQAETYSGKLPRRSERLLGWPRSESVTSSLKRLRRARARLVTKAPIRSAAPSDP